MKRELIKSVPTPELHWMGSTLMQKHMVTYSIDNIAQEATTEWKPIERI